MQIVRRHSEIEAQTHKRKICLSKRAKKRYELEYKLMKEQMGWTSPPCSDGLLSDSSEADYTLEH